MMFLMTIVMMIFGKNLDLNNKERFGLLLTIFGLDLITFGLGMRCQVFLLTLKFKGL